MELCGFSLFLCHCENNWMTEFFISFQDRNMDMRSLEHCLNDITNTPGVQSDLKGEFSSFFLSSTLCNRFSFNSEAVRCRTYKLWSAFKGKMKSSLKSVYKRLNQTFSFWCDYKLCKSFFLPVEDLQLFASRKILNNIFTTSAFCW